VPFTDREDRNYDWYTDKGTRDSPKKAPQKHREQNDEWRNRQSGACNTRLQITSDKKLDKIQAHEHSKAKLP
jgi:hypothetical protein